MQKAIIQLETLSCPSCIQKIDHAVKKLERVDPNSAKVLFNSSKVKANFDAETVKVEKLEKAIEDLGYSVIKTKVKAA
ncbi:heavy-metal-associated domain-containing protein [Lentibacillus sp.]|uniref:heavy-metal-associated domain-containing protein n=1 Tax=Lentibacillus sp. TaxID=1925746 RepID=UPI002B4AAE3D|nr:cation transporter [Lentibacillus sp.]HLS09044.1 cation transporter [Lentibacillus sp.]